MKRRFLIPFLLACAMMMGMATTATAQQILRPESSVFLKARVGLSNYLGDYQPGFDLGFNPSDAGKYPWSLGVELGYQFSPAFSLSAVYQIADYPLINPDPEQFPEFYTGFTRPADEIFGELFSRRHTAQLLARIYAADVTTRVAPFLTIGGHVSTGENTANDGSTLAAPGLEDTGRFDGLGYGAVVGLGLDIVMTDRASFTLEAMTNFTWPDGDNGVTGAQNLQAPGDGVDGVSFDDASGYGGFAGFDLLSFAGIGLKYNFSPVVIPVEVLAIDCPTTLEVGQAGTFSASVNEPTPPVEYRWNFGTGATATGLLATHSYDAPGTYNVTFSASNQGASVSRSCTVEVVPAPVAAEIVTIAADRPTFEVCEPVTVQFSANVRGDMPVEYLWEFEDGTTATGPTASKTYTNPGTYTVQLTVTNPAGTDTRTITVEALECAVDICDEIAELNTVYFPQNSSVLTTEARAALQENLEILRECPNICVRIEGYAAPAERNPQQLSEARAEAVEQYYIDNGLAASRFVAIGQGTPAGVTSKKEAGAMYRRAESIPVPCDQLGF